MALIPDPGLGRTCFLNLTPCLTQSKIQDWAKGAGVSGDLAAICKDPKTNEHLLKDLTATGKEGKLKVRYCNILTVQNIAIDSML